MSSTYVPSRISIVAFFNTGGRPSKVSKAKADFLAALPAAPTGHDDISFQTTKETCKGCQVYIGKFALYPCGHGKFCNSCVQKLHEGAEKTVQFCMCPLDNCFKLATDWVPLYNVSG